MVQTALAHHFDRWHNHQYGTTQYKSLSLEFFHQSSQNSRGGIRFCAISKQVPILTCDCVGGLLHGKKKWPASSPVQPPVTKLYTENTKYKIKTYNVLQ